MHLIWAGSCIARPCSCVPSRDIFNILLGAILGGSALTAIGPALADPGHIYITIGEALSKSSNFFINYITVQARPPECLAQHEQAATFQRVHLGSHKPCEAPCPQKPLNLSVCGATRAAAMIDWRV